MHLTAWYIWNYLAERGIDSPALDNWIMAEAALYPGRGNNANGNLLAFLFRQPDFQPYPCFQPFPYAKGVSHG